MLKIRWISIHLVLFLLIDFPFLTSEDEQVDFYQFHRTEAHSVTPLRWRPDASNGRVRCHSLRHPPSAPSHILTLASSCCSCPGTQMLSGFGSFILLFPILESPLHDSPPTTQIRGQSTIAHEPTPGRYSDVFIKKVLLEHSHLHMVCNCFSHYNFPIE